MDVQNLKHEVLSALVERACTAVEVPIDETRSIVVTHRGTSGDCWTASSRMLFDPPRYVPISEKEVADVFTVPVEVEAMPIGKHGFPTKFIVRAKNNGY